MATTLPILSGFIRYSLSVAVSLCLPSICCILNASRTIIIKREHALKNSIESEQSSEKLANKVANITMVYRQI